jgi:hypothetical protein
MISISGIDLTVKTNSLVKVVKGINLYTEDGVLLIEPEISLDFKNIPNKYHELVINILKNI